MHSHDTLLQPADYLPTRSIEVAGLTANGSSGPVSEVQIKLAFKKFGDIISVQFNQESGVAKIQFAEVKGSQRAVSAHKRDPLRLGGRPLDLKYIRSSSSSYIWLAKVPVVFSDMSEISIRRVLSNWYSTLKEVILASNQKDNGQCMLIETESSEAAAKLLHFLRLEALRGWDKCVSVLGFKLSVQQQTVLFPIDYASDKQVKAIKQAVRERNSSSNNHSHNHYYSERVTGLSGGDGYHKKSLLPSVKMSAEKRPLHQVKKSSSKQHSSHHELDRRAAKRIKKRKRKACFLFSSDEEPDAPQQHQRKETSGKTLLNVSLHHDLSMADNFTLYMSRLHHHEKKNNNSVEYKLGVAHDSDSLNDSYDEMDRISVSTSSTEPMENEHKQPSISSSSSGWNNESFESSRAKMSIWETSSEEDEEQSQQQAKSVEKDEMNTSLEEPSLDEDSSSYRQMLGISISMKSPQPISPAGPISSASSLFGLSRIDEACSLPHTATTTPATTTPIEETRPVVIALPVVVAKPPAPPCPLVVMDETPPPPIIDLAALTPSPQIVVKSPEPVRKNHQPTAGKSHHHQQQQNQNQLHHHNQLNSSSNNKKRAQRDSTSEGAIIDDVQTYVRHVIERVKAESAENGTLTVAKPAKTINAAAKRISTTSSVKPLSVLAIETPTESTRLTTSVRPLANNLSKSPEDPYELNFDEDQLQHPAVARTVTTTVATDPPPNTVIDKMHLDEVIDQVASGVFDMQSYVEAWWDFPTGFSQPPPHSQSPGQQPPVPFNPRAHSPVKVLTAEPVPTFTATTLNLPAASMTTPQLLTILSALSSKAANPPKPVIEMPVKPASPTKELEPLLPMPLVWNGRLSLKNAEAAINLYFINGNMKVLQNCMSLLAAGGGGTPQHSLLLNGGPLRIVQRMRLEPSQLEAVNNKMTQKDATCTCLAFPASLDQARIVRESFIQYMQSKCAAGIINVYHPENNQGHYVIHIFPPCEFSRLQLNDISAQLHNCQLEYLLFVITTV